MIDKVILDMEDFKSDAYTLSIDTKLSQAVPTAILVFPNETQITIRGDAKVIKQIIARLDGLMIEYELQ